MNLEAQTVVISSERLLLQLLRLKWAELLLLRAGDASSGEEKPGLIKVCDAYSVLH